MLTPRPGALQIFISMPAYPEVIAQAGGCSSMEVTRQPLRSAVQTLAKLMMQIFHQLHQISGHRRSRRCHRTCITGWPAIQRAHLISPRVSDWIRLVTGLADPQARAAQSGRLFWRVGMAPWHWKLQGRGLGAAGCPHGAHCLLKARGRLPAVQQDAVRRSRSQGANVLTRPAHPR
jgi:hypothetical protein